MLYPLSERGTEVRVIEDDGPFVGKNRAADRRHGFERRELHSSANSDIACSDNAFADHALGVLSARSDDQIKPFQPLFKSYGTVPGPVRNVEQREIGKAAGGERE